MTVMLNNGDCSQGLLGTFKVIFEKAAMKDMKDIQSMFSILWFENAKGGDSMPYLYFKSLLLALLPSLHMLMGDADLAGPRLGTKCSELVQISIKSIPCTVSGKCGSRVPCRSSASALEKSAIDRMFPV